MAIVGSFGDPEDLKIGSKITLIHVFTEQGQPIRSFLSYRLYVNELFQATQENLRGRYRQSLISTITWEDKLSKENNLPLGSCRGLHLISPDRTEIETLVRNEHVQQAFWDPASYIELSFTENHNCTKATIRQPSPLGFTKIIDLLQLIKLETPRRERCSRTTH